jgi:hypothetical protein
LLTLLLALLAPVPDHLFPRYAPTPRDGWERTDCEVGRREDRDEPEFRGMVSVKAAGPHTLFTWRYVRRDDRVYLDGQPYHGPLATSAAVRVVLLTHRTPEGWSATQPSEWFFYTR